MPSGFPKYLATTVASMVLGLGANAVSAEGPRIPVAEAAAVGRVPRTRRAFAPRFADYTLGERFMLAEDVALFRFLLPNADDVFDLKPCSTLQAQHSTGSNRVEQLQRSYTPITPRGTVGYFDIVVKKQHKGRMTEHLFSMQVGDTLQFRICAHKLNYTPNRWKYVGCIAGGTGISSVLQVIREIVANPSDLTQCSLLYGNQTEGKILLRGIIDDLAARHASKFRVFYTVDRLEKSNQHTWNGFVGKIGGEMIRATMPPPSPDTLLLICGSDKMMHNLAGIPSAVLNQMSGARAQQPLAGSINNHGILNGELGDLGYTGESVYRF